MTKPAPTLDYFKQYLDYDPDTGLFTWKAGGRKHKGGDTAGTVHNGYIHITLNYVTYRAHRVAWLFITGEWPEQVIDHRNGDRTNNCAKNLRDVSVAVNCQGAREISPRNKSGFTGVSWNKAKNCFVASRMKDGKSKFLGCFDTAEAAHTAYINADNLPGANKKYRPRRDSVAPQHSAD